MHDAFQHGPLVPSLSPRHTLPSFPLALPKHARMEQVLERRYVSSLQVNPVSRPTSTSLRAPSPSRRQVSGAAIGSGPVSKGYGGDLTLS